MLKTTLGYFSRFLKRTANALFHLIEKRLIRLTKVNRRFLFFLKSLFGYNISQIQNKQNTLYISDTNNYSLWITRINRLWLYKFGIKERIINLQEVYKTNKISLDKNESVIDIGANIGEFGKYWSEKGHKVYAFEPSDIEFEALQLNLHNSVLFNIGLWNESGELKFYYKNYKL